MFRFAFILMAMSIKLSRGKGRPKIGQPKLKWKCEKGAMECFQSLARKHLEMLLNATVSMSFLVSRKAEENIFLIGGNKNLVIKPSKKSPPAFVTEIRDKLIHAEIDGKKRAVATIVKYLATLSHILSVCVNDLPYAPRPVFGLSQSSGVE